MLEARQGRAARPAAGLQVALDLDDAGDGVARLTEEFQADGAGVFGHAVQHPPRRRDEAVAAFFLHAGEPAQEFVRDVLAESGLAECGPLDVQPLAAETLGCIRWGSAV